MTEQSVGPALRALLTGVTLPLPGGGATLARWQWLAGVGADDLVLARLAEAHADALAILTELGAPDLHRTGQTWGVWAAEPPSARLEGRRSGDGWVLTGRKAWCSGARVLDRALVSAHTGAERWLFAVDLDRCCPEPDSWRAVGMAASGSVTVRFDDVPATPVGGPGAYLDRPGFWHGGAGVAACWYGGGLGAARSLLAAARAAPADARPPDPHLLAHLGAVDALVAGAAAHLAVAAAEIDADPGGTGAQQRAVRLRARIEAAATEILDRVGRALGAGPLCLDPVIARRAADLPVYLRQSHAERDLAGLGALALERADW